MSSFSDCSSLYRIPPLFKLAHLTLPLPMQASRPTLVYKPPTFLLPTSYLLPLHPPHPIMILAVVLYLLLPLPALTHAEFFNGILEVFKPEVLNYYTSSRFILWILSLSRYLILIHLPLFGSRDTRLCDLIALTSGLAFFILITCTLAVGSSFRKAAPILL